MEDFKIANKPIKLWKRTNYDKFTLYRSLPSNSFRFVEYHIRSKEESENREKALVFWKQAEEFYISSLTMSSYSKPLTIYYCFMNAVKCLLEVGGFRYYPLHGITTKNFPTNNDLSFFGSRIKKKSNNSLIFESFYKIVTGKRLELFEYNLEDMLGHIPYVHRAFIVALGQKDLFLPTEQPRFMILNDKVHLVSKCMEGNLTNLLPVKNLLGIHLYSKLKKLKEVNTLLV